MLSYAYKMHSVHGTHERHRRSASRKNRSIKQISSNGYHYFIKNNYGSVEKFIILEGLAASSNKKIK